MGQGQSEVAMKLLSDCSKNGDWLCLKNLHLVTSWLPNLEKVLLLLMSYSEISAVLLDSSFVPVFYYVFVAVVVVSLFVFCYIFSVLVVAV